MRKCSVPLRREAFGTRVAPSDAFGLKSLQGLLGEMLLLLFKTQLRG